MMQTTFYLLSVIALMMLPHASLGAGTVSDNQRITSKVLGYDLQYRTYIPERVRSRDKLPVLYIADGQWYLSEGKLNELLDAEIAKGSIEPVIVVFIDSRNPDDLNDNRRNRQFFCNPAYVDFFTSELIPHIDSNHPTRADRTGRTILGLSFGGHNSACFGLMANESFANIAMQSPANTEMVDELTNQYRLAGKLPLKIFLSVGTRNDNTQAGRLFKELLEFEGFDLTYREVDEGHDWDNWGPLLDDVLFTFYAKSTGN